MRNKQTVMYCVMNLGTLGAMVLLYVAGVPPWLVAISAFAAVLLSNMTLWATFSLKRQAEEADALASDPELRRIARQRKIHLGGGLLLLFLGVGSVGLSFRSGGIDIVNLCSAGFTLCLSAFFLARSRKFRM